MRFSRLWPEKLSYSEDEPSNFDVDIILVIISNLECIKLKY